MKSVSVRDLRYNFKEVEELLRAGEELGLTKRRRVIARIVPEQKRSQRPDFLARMQEAYGSEQLEVTGAEIVSLDRDR